MNNNRIWLGATYVKWEGGYEILIKSLLHYKKRLRTIGRSPELRNSAAMFASILDQQARKTIPTIDDTIERIYDGLADDRLMAGLACDVPFMDKALVCYDADIGKAEDTGSEYFVSLVGDMATAREDRARIAEARKQISTFESCN